MNTQHILNVNALDSSWVKGLLLIKKKFREILSSHKKQVLLINGFQFISKITECIDTREIIDFFPFHPIHKKKSSLISSENSWDRRVIQ